MKVKFKQWLHTLAVRLFSKESASVDIVNDGGMRDDVRVDGSDRPISLVGEIPMGQYVSLDDLSLDADYASTFALLRTIDESMVILATAEVAESHRRHEIVRRLKANGFPNPTVSLATASVISVFHTKHKQSAEEETSKMQDLAWTLVEKAHYEGASDLHIETRPGGLAEVLFRVHGELEAQADLTAKQAKEVCNVLFVAAEKHGTNLVEWNPKALNDFPVTYPKEQRKQQFSLNLRFSSSPIHPTGNFHAVIRLVNTDGSTARDLSDCGYTPAQESEMEDAAYNSHGAVFVLGPTNSGKSNTLNAMINRVVSYRGKRPKIITAEDPVEFDLPRGCQIPVSDSLFANALKGMLRQDPDITVAGEVREEKSAEHVMHLVLAGRKMFTTLHVYEAVAAYSRLRELGIPDSVLYMEDFVSAFVAQRLVPVLCPKCSIPFEQAHRENKVREAVYKRVKDLPRVDMSTVRSRGPGCDHEKCRGRGIIGRTTCAEILVPTQKFLMHMERGEVVEAVNHWKSTSAHLDVDGYGIRMIAHAISKMKAGLLDPSDVELCVGKILVDQPAERVPEEIQ